MWVNEQSIETTAPVAAIWRLWAEVDTWPEWNADIDQIELSGPFAAGSTIVMTPSGQDPVELRLAAVTEPELFVDEAEFGDVVVRTIHRIETARHDRRRVVYRMEIHEPPSSNLGPELGPQISGDFPETLSALVSRAEG
jgi:hypothetical protein